MIKNRKFFVKAIERLNSSKLAFNQAYYNSCASNLYFSLFNLIQSILDTAPDGRWKHVGIIKNFSKYCLDNDLLDSKTLKETYLVYTLLYDYRKIADYQDISFENSTIKKLNEFINFIENLAKRFDK